MFKRVVVIADLVEENFDCEKKIEFRLDLERSQRETLNSLVMAIHENGLECCVYSDPKKLSINAENHKNDLVFTIYGGNGSRNRMTLVPAICETHGISYLGPDTYARVICQDKPVSKSLAKEAGFKIPRHILIRTVEDVYRLSQMPLPYVLKPTLEGSSIGISEKNLIRLEGDGIKLAKELVEYFNQPILAEEFIPGSEVSINFIQDADGFAVNLTEIRIDDQPDYFSKNLFNANEKMKRKLKRSVQIRTESLTPNLINSTKTLIEFIGVMSYGRIDGKFCNDDFYFLEITPDAWISPKGALAMGFQLQGYTYTEFIGKVINANRVKPPHLFANDL